MANSLKKVTALGAVASLSMMGLAACSNGDGGESNSASGDQSTAAPAGDGGKVEIAYMHRLPDGDGMVKVQEIADRWNAEHPDIHVTTTKFDGAAHEMIKKLETDIKANSGPCLAMLGYAEVPEMYVKGLVEDVTELADQYKDHYSSVFNLMKVGDVTVGLPQDTGPLVYYYNKAAFEELGIDVPTNLEEFQAAAAKAAEAGKYISAFLPDEAHWYSAQAAAAGGEWYTPENDQWKVNADSDKSAVVADFWQKMLDDKTTLPLERWGDAFAQALVEGKLIGTVGASWEAPLLMDTMKGTDNEGKWAVAQLPDYGAGALTGPDGGSGTAVMKGCEYPEQAMEFNDWFNTQIDDLVSQGLVVAALGEMKTPEAVMSFYGGQDVFAELAKANEAMAPNFSLMPYFSAVVPKMQEAAAGAADGSGKVADVYKAAQETSIKTLKDNGLPVAE